MKKVYNEDAPTVNTSGPVAGLGGANGEPGRPPQFMPMLRRKKDFAGAAVFEVSPTVFHSARWEKRKRKHWKTYLEEEDCLSEIREFAKKNPHRAIVLQNERTGEMCYARYGKKG